MLNIDKLNIKEQLSFLVSEYNLMHLITILIISIFDERSVNFCSIKQRFVSYQADLGILVLRFWEPV
jgi:hypothetical protein